MAPNPDVQTGPIVDQDIQVQVETRTKAENLRDAVRSITRKTAAASALLAVGGVNPVVGLASVSTLVTGEVVAEVLDIYHRVDQAAKDSRDGTVLGAVKDKIGRCAASAAGAIDRNRPVPVRHVNLEALKDEYNDAEDTIEELARKQVESAAREHDLNERIKVLIRENDELREVNRRLMTEKNGQGGEKNKAGDEGADKGGKEQPPSPAQLWKKDRMVNALRQIYDITPDGPEADEIYRIGKKADYRELAAYFAKHEAGYHGNVAEVHQDLDRLWREHNQKNNGGNSGGNK